MPRYPARKNHQPFRSSRKLCLKMKSRKSGRESVCPQCITTSLHPYPLRASSGVEKHERLPL
jgi:hypothetical protein